MLTLASRSTSCAEAAWNRMFQSLHSASVRMRSHRTSVRNPCRMTWHPAAECRKVFPHRLFFAVGNTALEPLVIVKAAAELAAGRYLG